VSSLRLFWHCVFGCVFFVLLLQELNYDGFISEAMDFLGKVVVIKYFCRSTIKKCSLGCLSVGDDKNNRDTVII